MFRRRYFRRLINQEVLHSRPLTDEEEEEIFGIIDSLRTDDKRYNNGLNAVTRNFTAQFLMKDYLMRNATIDEIQQSIDVNLEFLEHDVQKEDRYTVKDKQYYGAMKDAFLSIKEMLEELE